MHKLLLVTNQEAVREMFEKRIDYSMLNCRAPMAAAAAEEGFAVLTASGVDAVGFALDAAETEKLERFLGQNKPNLPVFTVTYDIPSQQAILKETCQLLDKLHADFSDDYYDEESMLIRHRDDLSHKLLAGEISDAAYLARMLRLIRSPIDPQARCVLHEIEMPQGDIFLSEHSGHAQQRLERALRNNFVGRYADGVCYAAAVLTPRHIRIVSIPMCGAKAEEAEAFAARVDAHVSEAIQNIRQYLDLEMRVTASCWLNGLNELIN